jgi:threonine dehydratase
VLVNTDQVCAAIREIFEATRTVVEPAGALALAGITRWCEMQPKALAPRHIMAIVCGANINFDRLRHVAERADIGQQSEAVFGVTIPEQAGSFLRFCQALGKRAVTEFNYRYAAGDSAQVFVGLALQTGIAERTALLQQLRAQQYAVEDYSDNEAAKLHVRHLVGGKRQHAQAERVYRFEFPERPGALLNFLERLSGRYNITLFHYRNHGAAYGRVLAGFDVAAADLAEFHARLDALGYPRVEETNNPALQQFLGV